jgi:hypothetical protein
MNEQYHIDPTQVRIRTMDELKLDLKFKCDVDEMLGLDKVNELAARFRDHSGQLKALLLDPLQEELHEQVVELIILLKFPEMFEKEVRGAIAAKERRIK